jgi:hypothetical protein
MFKLKLPPFENVAANQTAVLPRLPRGMQFNAIVLELGGTFTQAQCSAIRLMVNGKLAWNVTGTHLDTINNYDKLKDTATFLSINFDDPTAPTQVQQQLSSLDTTAGIEELGLEIDIGGATNPTLKAFGHMSPPSAREDRFKGAFKSVLKMIHAPGAAAQFTVPVPLGSKGGGFLRRVHFFHANVTSLQVKRDSVSLLDDLTIAEIAYMNERSKRTAQSGHVAFDPISDGNLDDMIPTLRSDGRQANFEFSPTVSGADTVTVYSEVVTTIDRV